MTIDLAAENGGTTLTHEGLPTDEIRARHNEGWDGSLDNLGLADGSVSRGGGQ